MRMNRTRCMWGTFCSCLLVLLSGGEALAAEEEESASDAEGAAEAEEEEGGEGRFRFGVSGMGGPMMGAYEGGAGGIDLRLGYQINNTFGIYAQPVGLVGVGASVDADEARASALALAGVGLLFEVTPINLFYFALGPEYLTGAVGTASASASSTSAGAEARAATGPFLSIAGRAGLALGSSKPNRRNAFTIGLDARVVFAPGGPAILPLLALGFDAF